ncbi:MAG: hypothetical protein V3U92_08720 [Cellulophaga sp.]
MTKLLKYTEYLYLIVGVVSLYEIVSLWNTERSRAYFFVFFAVMSIGMFLFRRKYRKKFENRKPNN